MNTESTECGNPQPSCSDKADDTKIQLDFSKICRTCRHGITNKYYILRESMYDMVQVATGVVINNKDKLPHQICDVCHRAIQFAYAFRQECQKVDTFLKSYRDENGATISDESILNCEETTEPELEQMDFSKYRIPEDLDKPCPICKRLFKQSLLELHVQIEHPKRGRTAKEKNGNGESSSKAANASSNQSKQHGKHTCMLCPWESEVYRDMITHYVIHHTSRMAPYQCPLCSDKLKHKIHLRIHLRRHLAQTYNCQYCGKHYADVFMFKRHVLKHTGVRPYQCTYCDKTFSHKDTLKVHIRRHFRTGNLNGEEKTSTPRDDPVSVNCEVANELGIGNTIEDVIEDDPPIEDELWAYENELHYFTVGYP